MTVSLQRDDVCFHCGRSVVLDRAAFRARGARGLYFTGYKLLEDR
jgi:hypothetical protein